MRTEATSRPPSPRAKGRGPPWEAFGASWWLFWGRNAPREGSAPDLARRPVRRDARGYPPRRLGVPVDRTAVLSLFDSEMRQDPYADPGYRIEKQGSIVRMIGPTEHCIVYSRLALSEAPRAVAEQAADFRARRQPVEWKVYAHDVPKELPDLLAGAGFLPKPRETLMVFDLSSRLPAPPLSVDIEIRQVRTPAGLDDLETVELAAFDRTEPTSRHLVGGRLSDPDLGVFVAYRAGAPVAGGRVDRVPGRSFAGLWGGGTVPEFRGRGIYRALVAARADFARARGARFLMVEALVDTSRPILERIGFQPLSDVVGWELVPPEGDPPG